MATAHVAPLVSEAGGELLVVEGVDGLPRDDNLRPAEASDRDDDSGLLITVLPSGPGPSARRAIRDLVQLGGVELADQADECLAPRLR